MAVKYLRSAAAGTGTGADWTNAYTTLVAALAGVSAGDTIYVADDHAETQATAMTLTSPGTAAAPVRIICANTHVTTPPTATATSATISNTGNVNMTFNGFAYVYGVTVSNGTAGTGSTMLFSSTSAWGWTFDSCPKLKCGNAGSNTAITIGPSVGGGSAAAGKLTLINTPVEFVGTGQSILLRVGNLEWKSTASAIAGSVPTSLFTLLAGCYFDAMISGVDLTAAGSGKSLITGSAATSGRARFVNCKLGASVSVLSGTIAASGGVEVYLDDCDSGNTNYRMEHYKYQGSIKQETTVVRSGGASDGTTSLSHKLVSLTTGPTLFSPLEGPWMTCWNESTDALTATVEFLHDSVTNLQNSDIYLEVEYLGTSGFPESVYSNNRVADVFATPADCSAGVGTGSWTTTGLTNPNSQKLSVTFTPAVKGPIRCRVCVVKSNYTVYVDPMVSGLGATSRSWLIPGVAYLIERVAGGLSRLWTGM